MENVQKAQSESKPVPSRPQSLKASPLIKKIYHEMLNKIKTFINTEKRESDIDTFIKDFDESYILVFNTLDKLYRKSDKTSLIDDVISIINGIKDGENPSTIGQLVKKMREKIFSKLEKSDQLEE